MNESIGDNPKLRELEMVLREMSRAMKQVYKCPDCAALFIYSSGGGAEPEIYTPYQEKTQRFLES